MDFQYVMTVLPDLLQQLPKTLMLVVSCFFSGFVLAVLILVGRVRKIPVLSPLLELYVSIVRCIPIVLLLFLIYYAVPQLLIKTLGIDLSSLSKTVYAMITLIFFNAAWISEILRGAYLAIEPSQVELANSLGYSNWNVWMKVRLPQMIGIAIPDLGNAAIDLLKDTSLLFTIGLVDLMGTASIIVSNNYGIRQSEVYLAVALVYWMATLLIEVCIYITKRTNTYYRVMIDSGKGKRLIPGMFKADSRSAQSKGASWQRSLMI